MPETLTKASIQHLNELEEGTVRVIVGILFDLIDDFELDYYNISGTKSVMLDATFADGKTERMFCSTSISKRLREKDLKVDDLWGLPVAIRERKDGSKYYQVQAEERAEGEGKLRQQKPATAPKLKRKKPDWTGLVAF